MASYSRVRTISTTHTSHAGASNGSNIYTTPLHQVQPSLRSYSSHRVLRPDPLQSAAAAMSGSQKPPRSLKSYHSHANLLHRQQQPSASSQNHDTLSTASISRKVPSHHPQQYPLVRGCGDYKSLPTTSDTHHSRIRHPTLPRQHQLPDSRPDQHGVIRPSLKSYRSHAVLNRLAPVPSGPSIPTSQRRTRTISVGPTKRQGQESHRPTLPAPGLNIFPFIKRVLGGTTYDPLPPVIHASQQPSTAIVGYSDYSAAYGTWICNHLHDKFSRFYIGHPLAIGCVVTKFCWDRC